MAERKVRLARGGELHKVLKKVQLLRREDIRKSNREASEFFVVKTKKVRLPAKQVIKLALTSRARQLSRQKQVVLNFYLKLCEKAYSAENFDPY